MSHQFWEGSGPHLRGGVAGRAGKLKPQDYIRNREGNGEAVAERSQALHDSRSLARKEERVRWSSTGAGVGHTWTQRRHWWHWAGDNLSDPRLLR